MSLQAFITFQIALQVCMGIQIISRIKRQDLWNNKMDSIEDMWKDNMDSVDNMCRSEQDSMENLLLGKNKRIIPARLSILDEKE